MKKPTSKPALAPHRKAGLKKPISITLDPALIATLDLRGDNRSDRVAQDLTRYYRLLAETRPTLRERFQPAELALILDACNGWWITSPEDCRSVWHNVEDAIRLDALDTKWAVADGVGLVQRLRDLTWLESLALCDAIERFWHAVGEGDHRRDPARALD